MKQAFATVSAMRFTPDGYLFGYDYDVTMKFHPDAKRVGENYKGKPDSKGFQYRDELVRFTQRRRPDGFLRSEARHGRQ